ncbi:MULTISPECIES: metalloregulator ArsR/SmtB family transcription factor [unclassified Paraburkholderia]|uniref:ArsR/SmtB family transcription factor n=1 Tax=unclassified Paraburkholderia TaxID=2615204 RepID=UPI000E229280|nr:MULTISPECIES: metalloregulator ArsR/SmtB family transcription factor [unclassified Paraburkholderia]REE24111.1 ArsR family transcriptional regulator [Paraburkholderia sp. BL27I4N3]RKR38240.1 ArsR family transcriptional regulator [Paraburkholderia sp. BL17N1]
MALPAAASLDRTLAALADPNRRQVVDLLSRQPMRAGELAQATGLSPQAMSRHLRVLRSSQLIEESHDGVDARVRLYVLRSTPMSELKAWLEQTEAMWTGQLLSFKAHLEAER